jgi:hypothetical protein
MTDLDPGLIARAIAVLEQALSECPNAELCIDVPCNGCKLLRQAIVELERQRLAAPEGQEPTP